MPTFSDSINAQSFEHYLNQLTSIPSVTKTRKVEEEMVKPLPAPKGFTFGCDPEAFVFKGKKPVAAASVGIPGTKAEPHRVDKGYVQVDGLAAEVNIDPASTFKEFNDNLTTVIAQLTAMLPEGHELKWVPSVKFGKKEFDEAPDNDKELGCQPDFDVHTGGVNPPPCPEDPYVRCAGGHLHIGWTENEDLGDLQHLLNCQDLGKQLDWFLALWSLKHDEDKVRRSLYGKMGACRYKPYGLEYRVLSNFWVPDEALRMEVWNRMVTAINQMNKIFFPDRVGSKMTERVREAINTSTLDAEIQKAFYFPMETLNGQYNRW